jgi:hypothetical protein
VLSRAMFGWVFFGEKFRGWHSGDARQSTVMVMQGG